MEVKACGGGWRHLWASGGRILRSVGWEFGGGIIFPSVGGEPVVSSQSRIPSW